MSLCARVNRLTTSSKVVILMMTQLQNEGGEKGC